jgi:hypothetical protein
MFEGRRNWKIKCHGPFEEGIPEEVKENKNFS